MVDDNQDLENRLAALASPVRLVFFTQTFDCDICLPARQVIDQIANLSSQVSVEEYNLILDQKKVAEFKVDQAPATAIIGKRDLGLRYYGIPSGYEMASFFDAIVIAAGSDLGLTKESLAVTATLKQPLNIKVFVTSTCAFCPRAVGLAYRLAAASDYITASVIEATGFPELVKKYRVTGVPKTIVNDRIEILGAQSEAVFVKKALLSKEANEDVK